MLYAVPPHPPGLHALAFEPVTPYVVDGSTIVLVSCPRWSGTAFYVGNGQFMTARHVMAGAVNCTIGGQPVRVVSMGPDKSQDWALVAADVAMRYRVLYSCDRIRPGGTYFASGYAQGNPWQVTTRLRGTQLRDADDSSREMRGSTIPGMSGGTYSDEDGVVYGIVSWGLNSDGDPLPLSGVVELADTPLCTKDTSK